MALALCSKSVFSQQFRLCSFFGKVFPVIGVCLLLASASARTEGAVPLARDFDGVQGKKVDTGSMVTDTLIVRGSRTLGAMAPATGALVTSLELDDLSGVRDAADLLDSVAGMQVRRYGGPGSSAVPSIRGSAAAQIHIFIDGLPLDNAQTGVVDLANIPLERFQTVDIHRGLVPVGLGGVGGSGAIDFHTRRADGGVDLKLFGGSFGERGGQASWGGATVDGSRSGLIMIHGRRSDNDYEFNDPVGTFQRTEDDTLITRQNAWMREHGALFTGTVDGGPGRVRSSLGFHRRDGGRPGMLGNESLHASVRYDRVDGRLGFGFHDDLLVLDLAGGRSNEFLYDPLLEVGLLHKRVTRSLSRDLSWRLAFSPVLWSGPADGWVNELSLQGGVEQRGQWFEVWYEGELDPERQRTVATCFGQLDGSLLANRLLVAPAWRWSRHHDDFPPTVPLTMPWLPEQEGVTHTRDAVSPSIGLVFELLAERIFLEAHSSRAERIPTWVELFGHRGGIDGNRDLLPEEISASDLALGMRTAGGEFSTRVALFRADTKQTIVYVQNSMGTSKALNAGASRTTGLELEARLRLPGRMNLRGNLTLQQARDRSGLPEYDGKSLPYLPDTQAWFQLVRPIGGWRPRLELVGVSRNFRDRYNTDLNSPQARVTANVAVGWNWSDQWQGKLFGSGGQLTTELELMNLTDNRTHDLEGFPLPGRSVHLAFRLRK
ncbi:MAG: TonB-dependent receptor [Gemmatimonadales bacterium]|nr:TonB-dependent receptor [Gemmatimonadales bacterium]